MLSSVSVNALLVLGGLSVNADSAPLKWKLQAGDTFFLRSVSTIKQNMTFMGKEVKHDVESTLVVRCKVLKKDANATTIEQTILALSSKGDANSADLANKIKGTVFTVTLNNKDQITAFEGYKKFVEKVADGNDTTRQLLTVLLPEETFKQMFNEVFTMLPGKAVKESETWTRKLPATLGPVGKLDTTNEFKYAGKAKEGSKDVEKITHTAKLDYKPTPGGTMLAGLPFKVAKGTLTAEDYQGTLLFDASAGRVHSSTVAMKFTMNLEIVSGTQKVEVTLKQESTQKTSVLDKSPLGD